MLIQANKLKRDYKIIWTYDVPEDCVYFDEKRTMIIKDCLTYDEAYERFCDIMKYAYAELDIEAVDQTHQQKVNDAVYELVLAELFDGDIAVYHWLDENEDNWEINADLEGLEKILVDHQAQLKFDTLKGEMK